MSIRDGMGAVSDTPMLGDQSVETAGSAAAERADTSALTAKQTGVVTLFSRFAPDDLIDEKMLALEFGKDERTIRRWGREGRLPPALPLPGKLRRVGNILTWLLNRTAEDEKKSLAYQRHLDGIRG